MFDIMHKGHSISTEAEGGLLKNSFTTFQSNVWYVIGSIYLP